MLEEAMTGPALTWRLAEAEAEVAQLRAAIATIADGVIVVDERAVIQFVNPAAAAMFGISETDSIGDSVTGVTGNAALEEAVEAVLSGETVYITDISLAFPYSRQVRAVVSASSGQSRPGAVVVLEDLTERARLDKVRRDFVANVSHELRTPVTSIHMMAENLLNGASDDAETRVRFLDHILRSSQRLVVLVDDLLTLARAESTPPSDLSALALGPIARSVVAALDPTVSEKRLDVGVDVPEDVLVWADAESVRQILSNLVDNAVKYTPERGTVDVRAAREGALVRMDVMDTGIGIPQKYQGRVFERFYRVDRARSREVGGTGLGLSIVKHMVEELGGSVSVSSDLGRGSTFSVWLPAPPEGGEDTGNRV